MRSEDNYVYAVWTPEERSPSVGSLEPSSIACLDLVRSNWVLIAWIVSIVMGKVLVKFS